MLLGSTGNKYEAISVKNSAMLIAPKSRSSRELQVMNSKIGCVDEVEQSGESDQHIPDSEFAFWDKILWEVSVLSATTWVSMYITLGLSWYYSTLIVYMFVAFKLSFVIIFQCLMSCQVTRYLEDRRPDSPDGKLDKAYQGWLGPIGSTVWDACVIAVTMMWEFASSLVEAIDPDMDAMTPGNVQKLFDVPDEAKFATSWRHVPLVGKTIVYIGLLGVLVVGMLAISFWQLYVFDSKRRQALEALHSRNRLYLYCHMCHMADCASLPIAASYFRRIWLTLDVDAAAFGGVRSTCYRARVPEMLFEGWFSVLALPYNIDHGDPNVVRSLCFPVFTSCISSMKMFCQLVWALRPYTELMRKHSSHSAGFIWRLYQTYASLIIHAIGSACIYARLVGVWTCANHDLQLTKMGCAT